MRARSIILIVLVVVLGAGTMFLVNQWLSSKEAAIRSEQVDNAQPKQTVEVRVLVAARALPSGRLLRPGDVRWQDWPTDNLPKNYIREGQLDPKTLIGAVARDGITVGQPISNDMIVRPGEQGFLAAALWPGMRAVSVPVNADTGVSGLVFPGDRVDLILVRSIRVKNRGGRATRKSSETILENVRILAIDQNTNDLTDQKNTKIRVPKTVTIEVTPQQVEMVSVAKKMGQLSLSLRSLSPEEDREAARAALEAREKNNGEGLVLVGKGSGKETTETEVKNETETTVTGRPAKRHELPKRGRTITQDYQVSRMNPTGGQLNGKVVIVVRGSKAKKLVMRGGQLDDDDDKNANETNDETSGDNQ